MKRIGSFISLGSVVILLVAVVGLQMAATKDFFSDLSQHAVHIDVSDPVDVNSEEAKHISFNLDYFDVPATFEPPIVTFSHSQLANQYSPISTSIVLYECNGRAPPA